MGIDEKPYVDKHDNRLLPIQRHGVRIATLGALMDPDRPAVWRGPMLRWRSPTPARGSPIAVVLRLDYLRKVSQAMLSLLRLLSGVPHRLRDLCGGGESLAHLGKVLVP